MISGGVYHGIRASVSDRSDIRYHNTAAATGKSNITVKNVYMYGTFGCYSNGSSTEQTIVEISGCRMSEKPIEGYSSGASVNNMTLLQWGNEISTLQSH